MRLMAPAGPPHTESLRIVDRRGVAPRTWGGWMVKGWRRVCGLDGTGVGWRRVYGVGGLAQGGDAYGVDGGVAAEVSGQDGRSATDGAGSGRGAVVDSTTPEGGRWLMPGGG